MGGRPPQPARQFIGYRIFLTIGFIVAGLITIVKVFISALDWTDRWALLIVGLALVGLGCYRAYYLWRVLSTRE